MPQMSPIKWTIISLLMFLNMFMSMIVINTMPKKLNFNVKFKHKLYYWNWKW